MKYLSYLSLSFWKLFILFFVLFISFGPLKTFAGSYYYDSIDVNIKINENSTFDVEEKQTYYLNGNFGFFNRDVALKDIDAISDIEVFDGDNKKISENELDIKSISGAKHIQWNFIRRDFLNEEKSWTVKYKVHGGISFLKNYDEIYWNAVGQKRDVPIKNIKVAVSLPNNEKFRNDLIRLYSEDIPDSLNEYFANKTATGGKYFSNDDKEAVFWGKNLNPNTNFTIAVGFSKGIVSQSAYWKDFLAMYYGYIFSILIFLNAIVYGFYHWYKTEKSREGHRAIIPQYVPPENIPPAIAEVIAKEKLTDKGLAATIIDLAVRGYIRIEEEKKPINTKALKYFMILMFFFVPFVQILIDYSHTNSPLLFDLFPFILFPFIGLIITIIILLVSRVAKISGNHDYKVVKNWLRDNDLNIKEYEKEYLYAIFDGKDYFSTKELKINPSKSKELYKKIQKVKDMIYKETELDTKAFEVGLTEEKSKNSIWGKILIIVIFTAYITINFGIKIGQFLILIITAILSYWGLWAFIKYEARLSDEGIKLKEDWLGFKMYLETAEKYRMQNLKPEYFEKYLPYAIIFGVEKKWGKAFESLNIQNPSWYSGAYVGSVGLSSGVSSGFSPSAFSASFSSSFSSAFSSAGGAGSSGGGGGAGGGGGGGGGRAG